MKRFLSCLFALILVGAAARAQEPVESELDFVRKLRARGYIELAREYLERMQKRNDPALAGILPLEQARTLLAVAREKEAEQRFGIFNQAREFLKDYTAKNAGKPEAAQGTLELARLSGYEGQALLTRALRELEIPAQQDLAKPAENKFVQAAEELEAAIKLLQGLVDDAKLPDDVKKQLKQELTQARFDKAINYIDQARTYVNTSKEDLNLKRAQIVEEARKVFVDLKAESVKSISSQANAWLMKIAMEQQDPNNVEKYYNSVMGEKDAESKAGHRWARLFDMQDVLVNAKNPRGAKLKTASDKLLYVQKAGLSWMKDFPTHVNSPEGQSVLWELAMVYYTEGKEAQKEKKKGEKKVDPEPLLNEAQKYFSLLAQGEGDFSEKAKQHNLSISFERMGAKKDFRTFEELYLKGQFELMGLPKVAEQREKARAGGDPKDLEAADQEWKAKLKEIAGTFGRAVSLANDRTPIQKLDEARYFLTSAFLLSGDLQRAAVAGEALGRTRPPTRRAPAGAGYAIESYDKLLSREQNEGTKDRLRGLIEYVLLPENQKFWATDPVTSVAHYQMAMLQLREGNVRGIAELPGVRKRVPGAIEELESLPKEFPAYIYAQGQLVFIALKERREQQRLTEKEKKELTESVRAAIQRMPPLPNDADSSTAYMYFLAQIEMSKLLYTDAFAILAGGEQPLKADQKYKEMHKFLTDVSNRFEKMPIKLKAENRERIDFELHIMLKYANLGVAEVQYRENKFDKVVEVTKPTVDAVKKADDGKGGVIKLKDFQVTGDTLGLALRAEVRRKNVKEAKELLDLVKRLGDAEEPKGGADGPKASDKIVSNLISEIAVSIREAKKSKDDKVLKELVGSFGGFLDALLKDSDPKKMPVSELRMLAEAFASLEQHGKAAELLAQFPAPKLLQDTKKQVKDLNEEELNELREYWSFQWELAKEHRKAKQYAEALKVVERWLNHPKAMFKMPYGAMEKNFILEDDDKPGPATASWVQILKALQPLAVNDPKMKAVYFDSYFYRVRTLAKYGLNQKDAKFTNAAAKATLDLEFSKNKDGWEQVGARFEQMLAAEPVLKEAYDRQKKDRK